MGALITEVALGYHIDFPKISDVVLIPFLLFIFVYVFKGVLRILSK